MRFKRWRGHYRNSLIARHWLTSSSPVSIAPYIIHSPDIGVIWDHLPEVIRENRQVMRMPYDEDPSNPATRAALARHYAGLSWERKRNMRGSATPPSCIPDANR